MIDTERIRKSLIQQAEELTRANAIQILLVEDNSADSVQLKAELLHSPFGPFAVQHVNRLEEAILRLHDEIFDVVLLDLNLPDSQGISTLQEMNRRKSREIPIVVLTGRDEQALGVNALNEGAADYLVKGGPFDAMRARSVRHAIDRQRVRDANDARDAELAHLSRVIMIGELAWGLAHELDQPLAAILNYATVCQENLASFNGSATTARTAVKEVLSETRRAGAIISRMRSFVHKQPPQRVAIDINQVVQESITILDFELRQQRIRPLLELELDLPHVQGDSVQIEQVLVNLLFNALQSTADGDPPGETLKVLTAAHGDSGVQVSVIDTGAGMSPETLARIFEPFFTTKSTGLGMGLNISRSIIQNHGGRLIASHNPDRGMRFTFTLPGSST